MVFCQQCSLYQEEIRLLEAHLKGKDKAIADQQAIIQRLKVEMQSEKTNHLNQNNKIVLNHAKLHRAFQELSAQYRQVHKIALSSRKEVDKGRVTISELREKIIQVEQSLAESKKEMTQNSIDIVKPVQTKKFKGVNRKSIAKKACSRHTKQKAKITQSTPISKDDPIYWPQSTPSEKRKAKRENAVQTIDESEAGDMENMSGSGAEEKGYGAENDVVESDGAGVYDEAQSPVSFIAESNIEANTTIDSEVEENFSPLVTKSRLQSQKVSRKEEVEKRKSIVVKQQSVEDDSTDERHPVISARRRRRNEGAVVLLALGDGGDLGNFSHLRSDADIYRSTGGADNTAQLNQRPRRKVVMPISYKEPSPNEYLYRGMPNTFGNEGDPFAARRVPVKRDLYQKIPVDDSEDEMTEEIDSSEENPRSKKRVRFAANTSNHSKSLGARKSTPYRQAVDLSEKKGIDNSHKYRRIVTGRDKVKRSDIDVSVARRNTAIKVAKNIDSIMSEDEWTPGRRVQENNSKMQKENEGNRYEVVGMDISQILVKERKKGKRTRSMSPEVENEGENIVKQHSKKPQIKHRGKLAQSRMSTSLFPMI